MEDFCNILKYRLQNSIIKVIKKKNKTKQKKEKTKACNFLSRKNTILLRNPWTMQWKEEEWKKCETILRE